MLVWINLLHHYDVYGFGDLGDDGTADVIDDFLVVRDTGVFWPMIDACNGAKCGVWRVGTHLSSCPPRGGPTEGGL